jgi:hypothetical protein
MILCLMKSTEEDKLHMLVKKDNVPTHTLLKVY